MKSGIDLIDEERCRQISEEGWTYEHDDEHRHGELQLAGRSYEALADKQLGGLDQASNPTITWPWSAEWWKPSELPIRNLEKAGALYRAEAERVARAKLPGGAVIIGEMNEAARRCGRKIDAIVAAQ